MRLYFDSNVYARITEQSRVAEVRDWLRAGRFALVASDVNREEAYRIADDAERIRRFECIAQLATERTKPGAFLDAKEVRSEIKRLHGDWLRSNVEQSSISSFLNGDRKLWRLLEKDPSNYPRVPLFDVQLHEGAGQVHRFQKAIRSRRRRLKRNNLGFTNPIELTVQWRIECSEVWWAALVEREPLMRDYFDYLGPFVRIDALEIDAWRDFWLSSVDGYAVARNKLISLANYFQLRQSPSPGNASDARHAANMLAADVFLTADKNLHRVAEDLRPHFDRLARAELIDPRSDISREIASAVARIV